MPVTAVWVHEVWTTRATEALTPEQRLADLTPEQRLLGSLTPEQRLADLPPDQRSLAMPLEALRALSEDYLHSLPRADPGLVLVTANVRHFARVPDLQVENWLASET
jgi:hypothetical protein